MADRIKYFEAIVDVKAQTRIGAFAYDKNEAKKIFDNYLLDNTVDNSSYIFEVNEQKVIVSNIPLAHPREVFSDVLKAKATAICLAHNHPSGNLDPSNDDLDLTKRLVLAGNLLGVKVLDHLIISTTGWYSFLEHGLL